MLAKYVEIIVMVIARYNIIRPLQYKKEFDEWSKLTDVFVKGCLNTLSYGFRLVKKNYDRYFWSKLWKLMFKSQKV